MKNRLTNILCLGIPGLHRKARLSRARARHSRQRYARLVRAGQEMVRIARLPVMRLTRAEAAALPRAGTFDSKACPLGTRFLFRSPKLHLGLAVVGEIVPWERALACQAGGCALAAPERFANRYRLVLAD